MKFVYKLVSKNEFSKSEILLVSNKVLKNCYFGNEVISFLDKSYTRTLVFLSVINDSELCKCCDWKLIEYYKELVRCYNLSLVFGKGGKVFLIPKIDKRGNRDQGFAKDLEIIKIED